MLNGDLPDGAAVDRAMFMACRFSHKFTAAPASGPIGAAVLAATVWAAGCDEPIREPGLDGSPEVEDLELADTDHDGGAADVVRDEGLEEPPSGDGVSDTPDGGEDLEIAEETDLPDTSPEVGTDGPDGAPDVVGDTGGGCTGAEECGAPYLCIAERCRLVLAGSTWAEEDFRFIEPEELSGVFDFLKSFTFGVKFLALDVGEGSDVLSAVYSSADIVDPESDPIEVRLQTVGRGEMTFRSTDLGDREVADRTWVSDPITYLLRTSARIEFPGMLPVDADFGLDAERMVFRVLLDPLDDSTADARAEGFVTRSEAESRTLGGRDDFPGMAELFCEDPSYDPGLEWNLSDLLDCNRAALDSDVDGDGSLDGYRVVIDANLTRAEIVE